MKVYIAIVIAAVPVLAVDFFYSLWAPADLLMDGRSGNVGLSEVARQRLLLGREI